MNKNEIRKLIRLKRENLSELYIEEASSIIFEKFINSNILKNANVIMSYLDFKNEVKTNKINEYIKNIGKKLLLPRVVSIDKMIAIEDTGNYSQSKFGNIEPIGEEYIGKIDLIITPGVAFDKFKNRIGFGRGYYDRFFILNENAKRVSIAFENQIYNEEIETDIYDKKVDMLITEKNIY